MPLTNTIQDFRDLLTRETGYSAARARLSTFTNWTLLPAAAAAVTTDLNFLQDTGVNPTAAARAAKGGIVVTQAGATNDASVLTGVAASAWRTALSATNRLALKHRVSVPVIGGAWTLITGLVQAASATNPIPAQCGTDFTVFLYDPAVAITTGLSAAAHLNWIVATRAASATVRFADSGVAVVASRDYELAVEYDNNRIPKTFISDRPIPTAATAQAAVALIAYAGSKITTGALTRTWESRWVKHDRLIA